MHNKSVVPVSVVLPCYNVEEYIEQCLKSICEQSVYPFEIIVVDDGSPDDSAGVADSILKEYKIPYKIIHKENGGVSSARNVGINEAKGEYVVCVDADDIIHPQFMEIIETIITKNKIDVIANGWLSFDTDCVMNCFTAPKIKQYSNEQILDKFLLREIPIIAPALVVHKQLIEECQLRYDESMRYSEDVKFVWEALLNCKDMVYVDEEVYMYRHRPNSTMTSSGMEKIKTAYNGLNGLTLTNSGYRNKDMIVPRWIFGLMHSSARLLKYNDFKILFEGMCAKEHMNVLATYFPKRNIRVLSRIGKNSLFVMYKIFRLI